VKGVVFDSGALIALDRGDRAVMILAAEARRTNAPITVPAGCIAQAWRKPSRQARLATFLRLPNVKIVALDDEEARLVGLLLARAGQKDTVDAHVVVCANRLGQVVLSSDPRDLRALSESLEVRRV
jgi:predicted nucleic acid-binding protein